MENDNQATDETPDDQGDKDLKILISCVAGATLLVGVAYAIYLLNASGSSIGPTIIAVIGGVLGAIFAPILSIVSVVRVPLALMALIVFLATICFSAKTSDSETRFDKYLGYCLLFFLVSGLLLLLDLSFGFSKTNKALLDENSDVGQLIWSLDNEDLVVWKRIKLDQSRWDEQQETVSNAISPKLGHDTLSLTAYKNSSKALNYLKLSNERTLYSGTLYSYAGCKNLEQAYLEASTEIQQRAILTIEGKRVDPKTTATSLCRLFAFNEANLRLSEAK